MKVLITGATGLVGTALGIELSRRGHELVVVSRGRQEAIKNCPVPCEVIEANLTEGPIESPLLNQIDGVINLMGEPIAKGYWTDSKKQKLRDSRIRATRNLGVSFKGKSLKVLVSASAIGFYGDRGEEDINESSVVGNDFISNLCQDWEQEALALATEKTRVAITRIGLVLTRKGGLLQELLPLFQAGAGGSIAGGRHWMSWIQLEDLVQAFVFALENPSVSGPFNAVAPSPVRNHEFTKILSACLHRPALLPVPKFALRLLLGEKTTIITASQKIVPSKLQQWGFKFHHTDLVTTLGTELAFHSQGNEVFEAQQWVPIKPEELFPFFADPKNLEKITPDTLNFKILSVSTTNVGPGTLIDYTLRIRGIPVRWRTLIDDWSPPHRFVDSQLKGPYSHWQHTHQFEKLGDGTLMTDRVVYKVPLGYLGWLGGVWSVTSEVRKIFGYRRDVIAKINAASFKSKEPQLLVFE
jgi:uncharacterized protein (TIGR01777 family)